jgi:hypothetical protein
MEPEGDYQKRVAARLATKETFQEKLEYLLGFKMNEFNNIIASHISKEFDDADIEYTEMEFSDMPLDASKRAEWKEECKRRYTIRNKTFHEAHIMWTKMTNAERAVEYEAMFHTRWARWLAAK